MTFNQLRDALQAGIYRVINPFVRLLIRLGFTPNAVTLTGLLLNVGVAVVLVVGAGHPGDLRYLGWAGAGLLFAGVFDMLDGQVARLGGLQSEAGALFDSVLDRYSELFNFLGICYYLIAQGHRWSALAAFVALIGSVMVSYTRARAEGLGVQCKGGLMQRPERVVLLGVSALACGLVAGAAGPGARLPLPGGLALTPLHVFTLPLAALALLANWTAAARLREAGRALNARAAAATGAKPASRVAAVLLLGGLLAAPAVARQQPAPAVTWPVPTGQPNMLFYLQRDPNTNTVVYQLNAGPDGLPKDDEPLNIYWLRYGEQGQQQALNYIQRRFAYGMKVRKVTAEKYALRFAAYDKVPLYLLRWSADRAFHVVAQLPTRQIVLRRIYLRIEGGTFWVPNVRYIELQGWDATTRQPTSERIAM